MKATLQEERRRAACRDAAGVFGTFVAAVGFVVLLGWLFDMPAVKSMLPGAVTMKANTALCFLLTGFSLRMAAKELELSPYGRLAAFSFAFLAGVIGLLTLVEYRTGVYFGIDEALFREDMAAVATSHPGRMAPNTAASFMLIGFSLMLTTLRRKPWPVVVQSSSLVAMLFAFLALTGYLYGVPGLRTVAGRFTHMALHTAVCFMILGMGVLLVNADRGLGRLGTREGVAGVALRGILPLTIVIFFVLGFLRLYGERAGLFTGEQGVAIFVVVRIVVVTAILVVLAFLAQRVEAARDDAREQLAALNQTLEERVQERTAELHATQMILSAERDFVSTTIDVMGALMIVLDREGRVVRFNKACEKCTGYAASEVVGRLFWDFFILPEELEGVRNLFLRLCAGDFPLQYENYWRTRDGGRRLIAWSNACITSATGAVAHVIGTGIDVTDQRKAEAEIRSLNAELEDRVLSRTRDLDLARERLEYSNRELEQFAYVASHDLQEPLRKISSFSSLLVQECSAAITPDGHEYLKHILNAVKRMQTLINDLLQLSRVSTRANSFVPVDLNAILRDVLSDLDARIREFGAVVNVEPLPTLEADATQMRQLFQNLVGNALKFRKEGEAPRVRVAALESVPESGRAVLCVEDRGIGFEPKYAERIFGLFQRLHGRLEYEGTGIGLTVCRRIVERHGGTIAAEGRPGDGATFRVELPFRHGHEEEGSAEA